MKMIQPHTLVWASAPARSSWEERDRCDNCATKLFKSHLSGPRNHIPGKKYESQVNVPVFRKYAQKLTGGKKHDE